jgi:hypothetical protein
VVVLVVSDDLEVARRARSIVSFVPMARVVDVRSTRAAVEIVRHLYESPNGCPDLVLLDRGSAGARGARSALAAACPGVRVIGFDANTRATLLDSRTRSGVRDVIERA